MAKKAVKRTTGPVPQSVGEVAEFVKQIGEHDRTLDQTQTDLNNRIEEMKAQALEKSQPHQKAIDELFDGILIFAQSRRDELTAQGTKKTVHLSTGDILWRTTPPAVSLSNVEAVIAWCKRYRLNRFIRIKEEIDKIAMLREPDVAERIEGVKIKSGEEFVVRPSEVKVEFSRDAAKRRKLKRIARER